MVACNTSNVSDTNDVLSMFSKRKLKAFYGKWIEALYSIDVETWDEYLKAVASGSADSFKQSSALSASKVWLYIYIASMINNVPCLSI